MSEGGLLAWKIQKIKKPPNGVTSTCNFSDLNRPLPDPPKDQTWVKEGCDWKLVPLVEAVPAATDSEVEMVTAFVEKVNSESDVSSEEIAQAVAVSTAVSVMSSQNNIQKDQDETIDGVMYHKVQETDTFQGLCLKYKLTPVELRRANRMMSTNLKLAPEKLIIPFTKNNASLKTNGPKGMTNEEKIANLVCQVRKQCTADGNSQGLAYSEARAYLEINDWEMDKALNEAIDDLKWSSDHS